MSRPFGWNYPPGAEHDPMAPWNQVDDICGACHKSLDDCECPECPICGTRACPYHQGEDDES